MVFRFLQKIEQIIKSFQNITFNIFLLFVLITNTHSAQNKNITFQNLSVKDGLSQSSVNTVLQDSYGFIWFGTQDGLNRYDGYNFKIYRHIPNDSTSLSDNWIWTIYEDSKGILWIGTFGGGICSYDRESETFTTFRNNETYSSSLSHNTVWSFYESTEGNLWIGTNNGLNLFDRKTKSFTNYPTENESLIFRIIPIGNNSLLVTTIDEVLIFNIVTKTFKKFSEHINSNFLVNKIGTNIFKEASGIIWMGSIDGTIFKYNPTDNILKRYDLFSQIPVQKKVKKIIRGLIADKFGAVWVTTNNGLFIMIFSDDNLLKVETYYNDPTNKKSISGNFLSAIHTSRGGEIWISGRDAINRYDQNNLKFLHYYSSKGNSNSLSHNVVLPIFASKYNLGIVWVGTRDGLNKFDERNSTFTHFKSDKNNAMNSLESDYILSLYEDKLGNLWVGTRGGGLNKLEFSISGKTNYTHYRFDTNNSSSLSSDNVHYIYEDSEGYFWIGTGGGGLNKFDPKTSEFKRYYGNSGNIYDLNDTWVYNILEDELGNLWIGTAAGGLNLFNRKKDTFEYFINRENDPNSISNNHVLSIVKTRKGEIWIGTAMGLNKLIPPKNDNEEYTFKRYFTSDGLPNDVIYGILEDNSENLWVSTNRGLCKIHFENNELKVRSYHISDGLQSDEFNQNSFSKDVSGKMYFGGINGFNLFHPDSIKNNNFIPPIVITDIKILNESVPIMNNSYSKTNGVKNKKDIYINYSGSVFLNKSITLTNRVELAYNDNVLSFEFAALNFTVPEQNKYAYMMEGFDADWIYSGTRRFVTYTNLDPGEYVFYVKGSNNDGIWNEIGKSITINITPPPWKTWWAYAIYFLLISGGIFLLIRNHDKKLAREMEVKLKIEEAKVEEREKVRIKTSQDFHDEAGNKLTKITLFTELANRLTAKDKTLKNYLDKIEENTKELSNGMKDFLWVLDAGKDSLFDMIKRLEDFGNSMFEYTETSFTMKCEKGNFNEILLLMEIRRSIILIFKEAMNNSLKYSDSKNILLDINLIADELTIILKDDGKGFDLDNTADGYGIKNMHARAEKIGGKLGIFSILGEGTKITFKYNITHMGN